MPTEYNPTAIEAKWQKRWEDAKIHEVDLAKAKKPYMSHVMFPYPSGDKLHVGHWYNFAPADSFARFMKMQGNDVFTPIGFDSFGLPAENYAIKTKIHPKISIKKNIETMIVQLKRMGCMYDWNKMVSSSHPEYYKWTQWLFLQMFKNNLAYQKKGNVNFCPSCQTVLANEQVWDGKCERCESEVIQKPLTQWHFKITHYAQRLLDGLENLDWPEKTKLMQKNWIGRKEGVFIRSKLKDFNYEFDVWDSVPQTYRAQTFTVIAPEHPMLAAMVQGLPQEKEVLALAEKIKKKKATKRFNPDEDMEGVFTGRYVDNPFGTGDLPLWIASYVVAEYGSGIVHCSAHDERDFAFAKQYDIPLRPVMFPEDLKEAERVRNLEYCYSKEPEAVMELPKEFKGRKWEEVREDIITHMEEKGFGKKAVNYRIRDWSIGRQRYWGALIPIVYDPEGKPHAIPEKHLPWLLPDDVEFKPTGTAPNAQSKELKKRTEKIFGKGWTPEVDTMDAFVCSSFYSLMYLAADHTDGYKQRDIASGNLVDPKIEKKWMPVQMYIGGAEHACMHLIYSRFVGMALKDFGHVSNEEPYQRLVHQGVITNQGAKMSKSKGNVVSPDAFIEKYGSDVFRMYLMFMGPFTDGGDWSDTGINGIRRFASRVYEFFIGLVESGKWIVEIEDPGMSSLLHKTIKKVTEDIERLHFNTALSQLMIFINKAEKNGSVTQETAIIFTQLLAPLAPHLAEELWEALHSVTLSGDQASDQDAQVGVEGFVIESDWPAYDASKLVEDTFTLVVQVNGKVRANIDVPTDISEADAVSQAKANENVQKFLEGKKTKKEVYVEGKLVSLVI